MKMKSALTESTLLDCTLRDGGYYTAWDFDDAVVDTYLRAMARLPVSIVELGYVNRPKSGYFGRYNFLLPDATRYAKSRLREDQSLGVMFDEKSIDPSDVRALLSGHIGIVDLVRIAVAPSRITNALALASEIREAGFAVGLNVMYLSKYWDSVEHLSEVHELAQAVNSVALVDSYGACSPHQVSTAVNALRRIVGELPVGFHGHDNTGLALANSIAAAESGASVIDGTVMGMGRGPGNTRMELLLTHKAAAELEALDHVALETVMSPFEALHDEYRWGTNLVYMASGAAGLPQNEVMDWLGKNRYSISAIVNALQGHAGASIDRGTVPALEVPAKEPREVVIVGGGGTVRQHRQALVKLIETTGPLVIHANYQHLDLISSINVEQIVCVAGDAAARLPDALTLNRASALVVPEGPRYDGHLPDVSAPVRQVPPFLPAGSVDQLGPVSDIGPLALALGTAITVGAKSVTLVGFDGYTNATEAEQELAVEVQSLIDAIRRDYPELQISSATQTRYAVDVESVYSRLARVQVHA
jgi:4-hydroxy 2-oxovalerate aldolase